MNMNMNINLNQYDLKRYTKSAHCVGHDETEKLVGKNDKGELITERGCVVIQNLYVLKRKR